MKTKYLVDGQEVVIERAVEGGFLVKRVFYVPPEEGDEQIDEEGLGQIEFVEKVFDEAPTEKLSLAIQELIKSKDGLLAEIDKLRELKKAENSTLDKVFRIPNLQMVIDYLSGDFKYVLRSDTLEITEATRIYHNKNICIEMVKGKIRLEVLQSDYFGADRKPVDVFQSKEDAEVQRKKLFVSRITSCQWENNLNDLVGNYRVADLMKDEEIRELAENKRIELVKIRKAQQIENAKREIEKNQKILDNAVQ